MISHAVAMKGGDELLLHTWFINPRAKDKIFQTYFGLSSLAIVRAIINNFWYSTVKLVLVVGLMYLFYKGFIVYFAS
jgi:hypothetical protein